MSMRVRVWRDGHEVDAPVRGKREKKVLIDPLGTQIQRVFPVSAVDIPY